VSRISPPFVDITFPAGNTYTTGEARLNIIARVQNIRTRDGVFVTLNGINISFDFEPGSGRIGAIISLSEGTNSLVVTSRNESGSARDYVNINFTRAARIAPPIIRFINPPAPVTVESNVFSLRVQTGNVKAWQDVTLRINNVNSSNFNFSDEGVVTTNIGLKEGVNNVEVSGKTNPVLKLKER